MKRKDMSNSKDFDKSLRRVWKLLDKANKEGKNPFKGMTTKEILREIRLH